MSKIHHFGDSYGEALYDLKNKNKIKHFVELISEQLGFEYKCEAFGGASNEQILNCLISCLNTFEKGDIVFINFTFFRRGCWYDDKNKLIKSTNIYYNELHNDKLFQKAGENKKIIDLVNYYIDYTEDYTRRIFALISSLLCQIDKMGVNIFYIFADDFKFAHDLLKIGNNIIFKNGFTKWLRKYEFHKEQEGHYSKGIQPAIANAIINKTNNLSKLYNKTYHITIEDIDLNVILKSKKNII
jgi:hypothetical protein